MFTYYLVPIFIEQLQDNIDPARLQLNGDPIVPFFEYFRQIQ